LYIIKVLTEYCVLLNVKESMHKAEKINTKQNLKEVHYINQHNI
jgi:hypothetical protein